MRSLIWPTALPDETLYSWVARAAALNAASDAFRFCQQASAVGINSVLECQLDPAKIRCANDEDDDAKRRFLDGLTLRTVERRFEKADSAGVLKTLVLSEWQTPSLGSLCRWKFCERCVESDIASYGVAYWHRCHQFALAPICTVHSMALKKYVVPTAVSRDQLLLPHQLTKRPVTDFADTVAPHFEFWQEFAQLCADAGSDQETTVAYDSAKRAIHSALLLKGIVGRNGKPSNHRFREAFKLGMQPLLVSRLPPKGYSDLKPLQTLIRWESGSAVDLEDLLMVVYWLFGGWAAFRARCHWELHMQGGGFGSVDPQPVIEAALGPRGRHRAICSNYFQGAELPSRAEFLQENPKSLRWLLEYDQRWLDNLLPLPVRLRQLKLFDQ